MTLTLATLQHALTQAIAETHLCLDVCEKTQLSSTQVHANLHTALILMRESLNPLQDSQLRTIETEFDIEPVSPDWNC